MIDPECYEKPPLLVRKQFSARAAHYDNTAVLQKTVGDRLQDRLTFMNLQPNTIVDLGCGTRRLGNRLTGVYKKARVYEIDMAIDMLTAGRIKKPRLFNKRWPICAMAESIPLGDCSADMTISNLMLQWCNDLDHVFAEAGRILQPGGLLIFSSFGPDTLKELRESWATIDDKVHVNAFIDMHDVGDALVRAGFEGPVMETEYMTLTYDDITGLMRDLKGLGAQNVNRGRNRAMTGRKAFEKLIENYEHYRHEGKIPATYEVIYGHAWRSKGPRGQQQDQGEVRVAVKDIGKTPQR